MYCTILYPFDRSSIILFIYFNSFAKKFKGFSLSTKKFVFLFKVPILAGRIINSTSVAKPFDFGAAPPVKITAPASI